MMFGFTDGTRLYIRGSEMTYGARFVGESGPVNKRPKMTDTDARGSGANYKPGRWAVSALVFIACLMSTSTVLANPSQDEVFKSISSNVNSQSNNGLMLGILAVVAAVVLVAAVWTNRSAAPVRGIVPLNHPGKLTRELMKATGLKHGQVRQLRVLADDLETRGVPVNNPLTLLLCPSLMRKAKEALPESKAAKRG